MISQEKKVRGSKPYWRSTSVTLPENILIRALRFVVYVTIWLLLMVGVVKKPKSSSSRFPDDRWYE